MTSEALLNTASILYALDMSGLMLGLALFMYQLTLEGKNLLLGDIVGRCRSIRTTLFVSALLFGVTVLPIFWTLRISNTLLRFYVWFAPLIVSSLGRVSRSNAGEQLG